jgi:hypothetical protein
VGLACGQRAPNNSSPFNNFILDTVSGNFNVTLTKVSGHHTFKTGYYYFNSVQKRGTGAIYGSISFANDTNNPLDSSFGFANAALGIFSSYAQLSRWGEGAFTADQPRGVRPGQLEDLRRLTLDYGMRFVHQVPNYDGYLNASQSFRTSGRRWPAPLAVRHRLATPTRFRAPPRTARPWIPVTGHGSWARPPQASVIAGTAVCPAPASTTTGLIQSGKASRDRVHVSDDGYAPRFGAAWDVRGDQRFVVRGSTGLFYDRPPANSIYGTVNNPAGVTERDRPLRLPAEPEQRGLDDRRAASPDGVPDENDCPRRSSGISALQMVLPAASAIDVSYTGQHSYNTQATTNLNSIDLGMAYLPQYQDKHAGPERRRDRRWSTRTSTRSASTTATRTSRRTGRSAGAPYHSIQVSWNRRMKDGFAFGFNDTISLSTSSSRPRACSTIRTGRSPSRTTRRCRTSCSATTIRRRMYARQLHLAAAAHHGEPAGLAGAGRDRQRLEPGRHLERPERHGVQHRLHVPEQRTEHQSHRLAGLRRAHRARGDTGSGCSSDVYRQFNAAAFQGPVPGSAGLESGNGYLRGCFLTSMDLSISRTIRSGKGTSVQLRLDLFNAFNQSGITARNSTMQMNSPSTPSTITNLPYDANGNLIPSLSLPRGAGFGVATGYQVPRSAQVQIRFAF